MRLYSFSVLSAIAVCLAASSPPLAGAPDESKYPLRVHIMHTTTRPSHNRQPKSLSDAPDYVDGMGAADLFEGGNPQGFMYSYSCTGNLTASGGYAAYPARWKKRDRKLEILIPQTGKPWNLETCELQTEMRPGLVFYWKNGELAEESAEVLKAWMVKHKYDPENDQVDPQPAPGERDLSADPQIAEPD
jgi:hypothetical protein